MNKVSVKRSLSTGFATLISVALCAGGANFAHAEESTPVQLPPVVIDGSSSGGDGGAWGGGSIGGGGGPGSLPCAPGGRPTPTPCGPGTPDPGQGPAGERTTPACYEEQVIKEDIMASIMSPDVQSKRIDPPGNVIMWNQQLSDPRYAGSKGADPNWVKFQVIARYGYAPSSPAVTPFTVNMHYMFNVKTRAYEQLKFKNSPTQGCKNPTP